MSTKKFVLRIDASITAGELAVMLQQLGTLPTYVDVPDNQAVPEGLKRFFIPVDSTGDLLSQLQARHEETEKRIQELEEKLRAAVEGENPAPTTQSRPAEVRPAYPVKMPEGVVPEVFERTLQEIRAKGEEAARSLRPNPASAG